MIKKNWKVTATKTNGDIEVQELYYTNNAILETLELNKQADVMSVTMERINVLKSTSETK